MDPSSIHVELLRDAYVCEYCSAYFKHKRDLQAHRDSGIHKDGFCWCQQCGKEFNDMKIYHHMRNFQQQRADVEHRKLEICLFFMCDYKVNLNCFLSFQAHSQCDKEMSTSKVKEWICQKHHAYWHEPMECGQCLKVVKNRCNYDTHMNVAHSSNKRYGCNICKKGFYHRSEMEAHKRFQSQLYSCGQCSFTTRKMQSLSVHVLGQHYKSFGFECTICKKHFGPRQGLTNHMQRVHGSKNTYTLSSVEPQHDRHLAAHKAWQYARKRTANNTHILHSNEAQQLYFEM
ncbi:hypothetical protein ACLKA7_017713 [Drosophila subpalustris]